MKATKQKKRSRDFVDFGVSDCARCGSTHHELTAEAFVYPVRDEGEDRDYTHWAECPVTGQPILVAVEDEKDEE